MNTADKLRELHYEYTADRDAAMTAEKNGNTAGAAELYRRAALALCRMAELETGETRKQRILHARDIKQHADNLSGAKCAENATPANGGAPGGSGTGNEAKSSANDDPSNPWRSEGVPSTTFDDVVGMEDAKQLIKERVINQIKNPELYAEYGLSGGTGILLFGLPGTGKTTIARAIAHEINAPLYLVSLSNVLSKWVGETEKLIGQLFDKARESECALIFFDDCEELGHVRTDDSNHGNKVIVELINQMDGFKSNKNVLVLLGATNKPWMIDSALMRPGRFEHHVYVPLPNDEARVQMITKNLKNVPVDDDVDIRSIAYAMKGYNGADIVSVVKSAKTSALRRALSRAGTGSSAIEPVSYEDFTSAISGHASSVDPCDIVRMREYANMYNISLPEDM